MSHSIATAAISFVNFVIFFCGFKLFLFYKKTQEQPPLGATAPAMIKKIVLRGLITLTILFYVEVVT